MIPVTKPFLPPLSEYTELLDGIWQRNWLTNNGPLVNDFESRLKKYLGLSNLLFMTNGTIAIQVALKSLGITGKVITTPFSYIATTSSLVWEGCTPVFADLDPLTLNIDPKKILEVIDEDSEAIVATHCFGNPCDIDAIEQIAQQYGLKVIFDAAHCFGTRYKGKSIFSFGDVSTTSFHATKLFQTIEGGAVFTADPKLLKKMAYMRNFGHDGPERFSGVGINGKNSEFHAAMGIVNLRYIDQILAERKKLSDRYDLLLEGLELTKPVLNANADFNYAYYPVIFQNEQITLEFKRALEQKEIGTRRYFYPSLSKLNYLEGNPTPLSDDVSKRILCLPLYHGLSAEEQELIASIMLRVQNGS